MRKKALKTMDFCIKKLGGVFLFLAIIIAYSLAVKPVPAQSAALVACQEPMSGAATVDGNYSEWNLASDFFADLYFAWNPEKGTMAHLYLRYDCSAQRMYALVLANDLTAPSGPDLILETTDLVDGAPPAWIKIDGGTVVNNHYDPTVFRWIDQVGDRAVGWEASFPLANGSCGIQAHSQVWAKNGSNTAGTSKTDIPMCIDCSKDYGDCPDTGSGTGAGNYQTLAADDGPSHFITSSLYLGSLEDAETNGQQSTNAIGDDNTGSSDEDGITKPIELILSLPPHLSVTVVNTTGSPAVLSGWIDLNGDGQFSNEERASIIIPTGTNGPVDLLMPTLSGGERYTYARFRLSTQDDDHDGNLPSTGLLGNGEVEDYLVHLVIGTGAEDHGDNPETYGDPGHTNLSANLQLGPAGGVPDGESESQFSGDAEGDDVSGTSDENGVVSFLPLQTTDTSYSVSIQVVNTTGAAATLVGWIDFDMSGTFEEDEASMTIVPNGTNGTIVLSWSSLPELTEGTTFARFRIALVTSGLSASTPEGTVYSGEVEDYPLDIENPIVVGLSSFRASIGQVGVNVEWEVQSAVNHAGYNLYRSATESGSFVKLNEALITSADAVAANRYQFTDKTASGASIFYRLEEVELDGGLKSYGPISATASTAVSAQAALPTEYSLAQNYPNPFNPSTTITYNLPEAAQVTLEVLDMSGRCIRTLVYGVAPAGSHQVVWDARNDQGQQVASGAYVYRIKAGDYLAVRRMTLIK